MGATAGIRVKAATGTRAPDRQRSQGFVPDARGPRWRAWPGVRELFPKLRGQSAQNGRGPPEQPGLGAEEGVKTFPQLGDRDRTRTRVSVMLGAGISCRLTAFAKR